MESFGAAFDIKRIGERRDYWKEAKDEKRRKNHEEFGWPIDAECVDCGDTGKDMDGGFCRTCKVGLKLREQKDHEDAWFNMVPRRFAGYRLDAAPDQDAAQAIRDWIASGPWSAGKNLIVVGPIGTGKTGLAIGTMRILFDTFPIGPKFYGVPALLDSLRPDGDATVERVIREKVVILDDLGVEKASEWVRERLYLIINGRYEAQRSTIVTTNCSLDKLAELIGERTVSRLQEDATIIPVGGSDRRRG